MKTVLKRFSTLALVAGISVALAFGAKEATACEECNMQPGVPCLTKNPDLYCATYCINVEGCAWGECRHAINECTCAK